MNLVNLGFSLALGVSEKALEPTTPMPGLVERTSFVASLDYFLTYMDRTMPQSEEVALEPMPTNVSKVVPTNVGDAPSVLPMAVSQRSNYFEDYFATTSYAVVA